MLDHQRHFLLMPVHTSSRECVCGTYIIMRVAHNMALAGCVPQEVVHDVCRKGQ
jgi:hypothetical protein